MSGSLHTAACIVLVAACGGGAGGALTVTPATNALVPGQAVQLVASDDGGQAVAATWTSSDATRATVDASGRLTGVAPGAVTVTAAAAGAAPGTAAATISDGGLVDTAGTVVTALAGKVTLDVPAGAVAGPTPVVIRSELHPALDPRIAEGAAVIVHLDGAFAAPATLSIAYDPAKGVYGLPAGREHVATLVDQTYTDLAASADDPAAHRARVGITTSGTYVVRSADPAGPCTAPEDRQFDFWLGSWRVEFVGQGIATSDITRDAAGCTIYEAFHGLGTEGRSVSFHEPVTAEWYQTYVDDSGGRILTSGTLENGRMVLVDGSGTSLGRIVWSNEADGVHQVGAMSSNGGQTWTTNFVGVYTPR